MSDGVPPTPLPGIEPGPAPDEVPPLDSLLITDHLSKSFGGLHAVSEVTFWIPERGIVSIIGPNGAGKTTFFNMLTGLYRPTTGMIAFRGRDITALRPDRITALGVARTFQNIRLFGTMTALENVLVGEHSRMKAGLIGSILRTPGVRHEEKAVRDKAREVLEYVGLPPRVHGMRAVNLSYGDQRRVEIARALASDPTLLLLDEPTAGHERGRVGAPGRVRPAPARRARRRDPADRARHEGRDEALRARHRARPRREGRRGRAAGGGGEPARRRGLPGQARRGRS